MKKFFYPALLLLSIVILVQPVIAADLSELSGTVYSQGAPVANLTITVKESDTKTKTGPKGEYKLDLAPGKYTLVIRGKEFPVTVESGKTSHDIQL